MKIKAAPITSKPVMLGFGDVPIPFASSSQPPDRFSPTPMSMYRIMIFTPVETPSPMYRST